MARLFSPARPPRSRFTPSRRFSLRCLRFRASRPAHSRAWPFTLVLSGWQRARSINAPAPATRQLLEQISSAMRLHGREPGSLLRAWLPSDGEFADLCEALRLADRDRIGDIVRKSLAASTYAPADAMTYSRDHTQIAFTAARRHLVQTMEGSHEFPLAAEAAAELAQLDACSANKSPCGGRSPTMARS